jgi:hypothetical protein
MIELNSYRIRIRDHLIFLFQVSTNNYSPKRITFFFTKIKIRLNINILVK